MKVWIDRDFCEAKLSSCLFCLSQLARTGRAGHACIKDYAHDGSKTMAVFAYLKGQDWEPFLVPKELLDMIAYEYREGVLAPKIEIEF